MKITVKVLKGAECTFEVENDTPILQVKHKIELLLNIPILHQKLLYIGRTLMDDKTIGTYNIKDTTKLTLVIKKPSELQDVVNKYFKKYYSEQQSERLTKEFMIDFENKIKHSYSLDDLERIACNGLGIDK